MVTVTIYFGSSGFLLGVNSSGPLSSGGGGGSGFFCAAGAGFCVAGAGFGGAAAGAAGLAGAGFGVGCAGGVGGRAEAGVGGNSPTVFSLCFQARAHSGQSSVFLPPDTWGTVCLLQSGCSQLAHLATAGWPHGFFFRRPVSTVQVSVLM
jgi:hypothetical protein